METFVDTRGLPRTWMLAHRPEAAGEARKMAERTLAGWKVAPEIADPVLLVVSELVTNAVEHARPPLTLRLSRDAGTGRVRVEVTDGGPAATEGEWAASCGDEERGRGLDIVDRVAAAHGDRLETGHAIHWADLTTAA
ncbi:ATP-binding protein [Streptomyces sp. NPDC003758]|uniref:ATP-binding protein n=1 Tax=Streptomyces cynarae TaxID=2981134 RepID=A0ABY6E7N2_9ACTN|nr:ATP-binding protein [Streptomyces cynarae]UXY22677.1 ATP-binding protein [Streptomyces cynarae]